MRRKPAEELKKGGTYRKDRHGPIEAAGALLKELPEPPFYLSEESARVYQEEGQRLIELKLLKASDLRLLAMYAAEMGVYISEMEAARAEGVTVVLSNGVTAISHHRRAAEQALKLASGLSDKLGLSPAARARLKGVDAAFRDERPDKKDPFMDILALMDGGKRRPVDG